MSEEYLACFGSDGRSNAARISFLRLSIVSYISLRSSSTSSFDFLFFFFGFRSVRSFVRSFVRLADTSEGEPSDEGGDASSGVNGALALPRKVTSPMTLSNLVCRADSL